MTDQGERRVSRCNTCFAEKITFVKCKLKYIRNKIVFQENEMVFFYQVFNFFYYLKLFMKQF